MSRRLALLIVGVFLVLGIVGPWPALEGPHFCVGALHAQAVAAQRRQPGEESHFKPDEWCQREKPRSDKAHQCACHQAKCDDPDPSHLPAHTDVDCEAYCLIPQCLCVKHDCP